MSKKCFNCGGANSDKALFCENCGKKFEEKKICPICNTENNLSSKFCNNCGKKIEEVLVERPQNINNSYWEKRFSGEARTGLVSADKVCPTCNTVNSAESRHCKKCGENLNGFMTDKWQTNISDEPSRNFHNVSNVQSFSVDSKKQDPEDKFLKGLNIFNITAFAISMILYFIIYLY